MGDIRRLHRFFLVLLLLTALPISGPTYSDGVAKLSFSQYSQAIKEVEVSLETLTRVNWQVAVQISHSVSGEVRDYGWEREARRISTALRTFGTEFDSIRKLEQEVLWWEDVQTNPGNYVEFVSEKKDLVELAGNTLDTLDLMLGLAKYREFYLGRLRVLKQRKITQPNRSKLPSAGTRIAAADQLMDDLYFVKIISPDQYLKYLKAANCYENAMGMISGKPLGTPRPGDVWIGDWEGELHPNGRPLAFFFKFSVSRVCSEYTIQSIMAKDEEIEIIRLRPAEIEFRFLGPIGTRASFSLIGKDAFTGEVIQPQNSVAASGQVEGIRVSPP